VGITGSLLCVSLGSISDKIIGFFFAFVSLMQIIDYLLWNHQICDWYNRYVSILGMILNNLQPIVLGLLILFFNSKINKNSIYLLLFIYLCFIIPYSSQFQQKLQCTLNGKNVEKKYSKWPYLKWQWNHMNFGAEAYSIFIIVTSMLFLIGLPNRNEGIFFAIMSFITFFTSYIFYSRNFAGHMWCYYVVFWPIIYYMYVSIQNDYE